MALTSDDLIDMRIEILNAGGKIHGNHANNIIHAYNIWCINPNRIAFAIETAELVYIRRDFLHQNWTNKYGR